MKNQNHAKTEPCFHNPFKRNHCSKCGACYDGASNACPNCHEKNVDDDRFLRSFGKISNVSPLRELFLFLMGWLGFQAIAIVTGLIVAGVKMSSLANMGYTGDALEAEYQAFTKSAEALAWCNYPSYIVLFAGLMLILWNEIPKLFPSFKRATNYLAAFGVAGVCIGFSFLWSFISQQFFEATTNENQLAVNEMVLYSPVCAVLITGIIGPLCEELTYRVGLFGFAKRINRVLAYIVASLLFGLIHIQDFTSPNEWLSYPTYVFSGLALAFAYERFGLATSWTAHSLNNLLSVILILLEGKGS